MKFWVERVMPLVPFPIRLRLHAERAATMATGRYDASTSRYLVLGTLEDFKIECWHPFRKSISMTYYGEPVEAFECLLCGCSVTNHSPVKTTSEDE